jgi:hypothetical protein
MTTDTTEKGLEALILRAMTGRTDVLVPEHVATETSVPAAGGTGWLLGDPAHYDRDYCIDLVQLRGFLLATQPDTLEAVALATDGPTRRKFLARLQGEITRRGTIDVLRHGLKHGPHHIDIFYGTPSVGNPRAIERFAANRFSVTRQLRYSRDESRLALDLGLFINGLPVATFELKNSLTKQTVDDAVEQYKRDRDPREKLFEFGRCVVHLAVDDNEAAPIRKEVRSGCFSEHRSKPTPGGASRAASSADGSHRELVRSGVLSGRPPGGWSGRPASCGRSNLTPLGPGFLNIRQLQLLAGEDDSPARSVAETNPVVVWPSDVDALDEPAHKSVDGPSRLHQLLRSDADWA